MKGMHLTPIGDGHVLLEPGVGLDPSSIDDYLETIMAFLQQQDARCLIYDLKNLPVIDAVYYKWLEQLQDLCSIGGQYMIVVNMQPTAAYGLATFLKDPPAFACARDVHHARAVFAELD